MKFKRRTLMEIADMICGNSPNDGFNFFIYRSSSQLSEFFKDAETPYRHDGTTRNYWVAGVLEEILAEPHANANTPPETFCRVIAGLMDLRDVQHDTTDRDKALEKLNSSLSWEGFEAFYGDDRRCYLRHKGTHTVAAPAPSPHRPFSDAEQKRRNQLKTYLETCSEDELIEEILLPLFRQLGFHRITAAGHKDKALEYGKDVWMKFKLPTEHMIYFGIQVKKDKLDAAGMGKPGNANISEIFNQVLMMLGHEIFDPEIGKKVLVDHAFIVAGGEITKQARNWLGGKLDATQRSQVMFMDRDDILNLYVVTNLPLPASALPSKPSFDNDFPF